MHDTARCVDTVFALKSIAYSPRATHARAVHKPDSAALKSSTPESSLNHCLTNFKFQNSRSPV